MTARPRQLHLNAHVSTGGNHEGAWRHHRSEPVRLTSLAYQRRIALTAERGKFDAVFHGDTPALSGEVAMRPVEQLDPVALHGALSAVTQNIGLAATISTSFNEPFNVARKVASLDLLSEGRSGWNIVTTSSENAARNFGLDVILSHSERYRRADEFVEVVRKLWASWTPDAIRDDRESGLYADAALIRQIRHEGEFFKVLGPLNVPPSAQGRPVLIQAGSSEAGIDFAARHAEVIFTAQRERDAAQRFYRTDRQRVAAHGRDAERIRIVVGLSPIIGGTEAEAKALSDELDDLTAPEYGLRQLQQFSGIDLSGYPLDGPVPLDAFPEGDGVEAHRSRSALALDLARRENLTIRGLLHRFAGARGHQTIVGTPEQVAARMADWFENEAADGFNIMPAYLPGGLDDFVDQVVPILQRRGLFRRDYQGTTLRSHYDIEDPVTQRRYTAA